MISAHLPRLLMVALGAILPALDCSAADAVGPKGTAPDGVAATSLLAALPHVSELAITGTQVHWIGIGVSATVSGIDDQSADPLLGTAQGPLRVAVRLVRDHDTQVLAALPQLLERARAAHLDLAHLELQDDAITGPSLHKDPPSDTVVVLVQGILRKQELAAQNRQPQIQALGEAAKAVSQDLAATGLGEIGRESLAYVIAKLPGRDGGQTLDDEAPSFVRRLVRHGWLRQWFQAASAKIQVIMLERAVIDAERLEPTHLFVGDGLRLAEVEDAFGRGGWVFSTPQHVLYARPEIHPSWLGRDTRSLLTVIELPAGADPIGDARSAATALSARNLQGTTTMASWSRAQGFHCNPDLWRSAVAPEGSDMVPDVIPPHVLISALNGDIAALAVEKGLLQPVQDGSHASAERFITDAAKLLPDAAHLDLIGEYLFTYALPSPDAKNPELLGNPQLKSNVQQTFYQTCGNTLGGVMHGDCADIAELYQTITERQGRNPIVIGLPEHAACAWAAQNATSQSWTVDVLQTGPPMHFTDARLPECLGKAYKSFDASMNFDANALPLLLRFSGEVSRSEWSLSWRIFKEPAYAKTMIDVQKDWHYQTYQRGITAMRKLIADGDKDNANFRELSGLFTYTGQYDLAAEYQSKAIELTSDAPSRMYMTVHQVLILLSAGRIDAARAAASDVLDHQLPALKDSLGPAYLQAGLELAAITLGRDSGNHALTPIALRVFKEILTPQLSPAIDNLGALLEAGRINQEQWNFNPQMRSARSLLSLYATLGVQAIAQLGPAQLPGDQDVRALTAAVQKWLDAIAFHDIEEQSMVMQRYATLGEWYAGMSGQEAFYAELDAAAPATDATLQHALRQSGTPQRQRDLGWIRASVHFWFMSLTHLLDRDHGTLDTALVARLVKHLHEAHRESAALGMTSPACEIEHLIGSEIGALIGHDEPALRTVLQRIASAQDKMQMDIAAQMLGLPARFLDVAWYARVLKVWREVVDYKPKYFAIAWTAALNNAPRQALMAGELAAQRFPDDPDFTQEYGYMRTVLSALAQAGPPAH